MSILLKAIISALIIVAISELAKRETWFAALFASLPLTLILSFCWIYYETGDAQRIAALSREIVWFALPSLVFFFLLPPLLDRNMHFALAMLLSCAGMLAAYGVFTWIYRAWH